MKFSIKICYTSVVSFTLLLLSTTTWAIPGDQPKIAAKAYILLDYYSGTIISEKNIDDKIEPASLTKMMTMYVVDQELRAGNIKLDDKVTISRKARHMDGSRMFLELGSQVSIADLVKGLIIQSGNDAAIALAEAVAGTEEAFVVLMNAHAHVLKMENSHFANATGLPNKEHYSTVRDLAKLSGALIKEFPDHYALYKEKTFRWNKIRQKNRNRLLWMDKRVDGIKTGHTDSAGYCLAASATQGNMRLVSVLVGARSDKSRAIESQKLLTFGFRFYETHKLYTATEALTEVRIWQGDQEQVPLGLPEDLFVTIPRGQYNQLKATMSINKVIMAPVKKGLTLGTVKIALQGEPLLQRDLVTLKQVAEGSVFQKAKDKVLLMLE